MGKDSKDRVALLPKPLVAIGLTVLILALAAGYVFGLRADKPDLADRPANVETAPFGPWYQHIAFLIHQGFRARLDRGELSPAEADIWLALLLSKSDAPGWGAAYVRALIRLGDPERAVEFADEEVGSDLLAAAADAAVTAGRRDRFEELQALGGSNLQGYALSVCPAARFMPLSAALQNVADALEAGDTVGARASLFEVIALGSSFTSDRPGLYELVSLCPARPSQFGPAREFMDELVAEDPNNEILKANATFLSLIEAAAWLAILEPQPAGRAIERASESGYNVPDVLFFTVLMHEVSGDLRAAELAAREGVELFRHLFRPVLARVLIKQGRIEEAREIFGEWPYAHRALDVAATQLIGLGPLQAGQLAGSLVRELGACSGIDGSADRGVLLGSDRFRCEFLGETVAFQRWFGSAFALERVRPADDLALAVLNLWEHEAEAGEFLLGVRPDRYFQPEFELVHTHLNWLRAVQLGNAERADMLAARLGRLRSWFAEEP